jgi:[acyl-carrier-protein] S-malonyltransferase
MVAYIFPGQGAQYVGMGKALYDNFPIAREIFDKANRALGFDIAKICFEGPESKLIKTEICQPAILTVSIACLETFRSQTPNTKHLTPRFAAGLSLGEYSALVAAGSLKFEDGVKLVWKRGQFMEEVAKENPGKMAAIFDLSLEVIKDISASTGAEIANLNCPGQVVISGSLEAVTKAIQLAKDKGAKKVVILEVSGPFHSSLMRPASSKLEIELKNVDILPPEVPVVSNVTARCEILPDEIRNNLTHQIKSPTRWEDSMKFILSKGIRNFIEFGPGKVLKGLLRRIDTSLEVYNIEKMEDIKLVKWLKC